MAFYSRGRRPLAEEEKSTDAAKARTRAMELLAGQELSSGQLYERLNRRYTQQTSAAVVAEMVQRLAPHAYLLNFTNPAGIVTEAVSRYSKAKIIGLCNVPINMQHMIAGMLGADENLANRAALLSKADLLTDMVGEFPELQGTMGRYYALAEGALPVVAEAIEQHYRPRFAGDALPDTNIGRALALADKLDSLVGFFGIGQLPTGDRDPFGLRRAALGVLRILMESPLPLDLVALINESAASYAPGLLGSELPGPLFDFMLERLRNQLREAGHAQDVVDAVLALKPTRIDLVVPKLQAVVAFQQLPEAAALAAANKRIVNILKKADGVLGEPDVALLAEDAEKALFHAIVEVAPLARSHFQNEDYTDALRVLAGLRAAVDRFFDEVMVMAEEPLVRQNRLALLGQLAGLMNQVADISRLSA